jgi:hypothetical protein
MTCSFAYLVPSRSETLVLAHLAVVILLIFVPSGTFLVAGWIRAALPR